MIVKSEIQLCTEAMLYFCELSERYTFWCGSFSIKRSLPSRPYSNTCIILPSVIQCDSQNLKEHSDGDTVYRQSRQTCSMGLWTFYIIQFTEKLKGQDWGGRILRKKYYFVKSLTICPKRGGGKDRHPAPLYAYVHLQYMICFWKGS